MNAKQIRELMGLGIDGELLVSVVTIFDVTDRDARQKSADRSMRYRQRKRHERSVTQRDGDLLSSLTSTSKSKDSEQESKKEKKERARRKSSVTLRDDWRPTPAHFDAAKRLNLSVDRVYAKAEDMRLWAKSTDARKVDWDATFHGFMRRDVERGHTNGGKQRQSLSAAADFLIARAAEQDRTLDLEPTDYTVTGDKPCK